MMEAAAVVLLVIALLASAFAIEQRRENARLVRRGTNLERSMEAVGRNAEGVLFRETAISQTVSEALIVVNAAREVIYVNDQARELFADVKLIGRRVADVAWGFDLGAVVADALAGRIDVIQQTVVRGGQSYLVRARPVGPRAEYGAVLAFQDVTELQRLGRARRDFVANISHELRTPLASIKLLVDTLSEGAIQKPDLASDLLAKIDVEVDALRQLSDEMLDLAQIESGQAPLELAPTSLRQLVDKTVTRFALPAAHRQVSLQSEGIPDANVLVDSAKFDKILGNLVHNAIKFTSVGGCITVKAFPLDDMFEISVQDTGQGIPAEELPRIFERFYKVDRARSRGEKGTGLGLAIARHLVEAHGGRIWAESVEGRGATFHFTVPKA